MFLIIIISPLLFPTAGQKPLLSTSTPPDLTDIGHASQAKHRKTRRSLVEAYVQQWTA